MVTYKLCHTQPFCGHYTTTHVSWSPQWTTRGFCWSKFYCPYACNDDNNGTICEKISYQWSAGSYANHLYLQTADATATPITQLPTCQVHLQVSNQHYYYNYYYNHFMALWILSGATWVSQYQKGKTKTNLNFLVQETVSGSGISWAICKSALRPRQITTPAPHHSFFTGWMPFLLPTNSVKALKAMMPIQQCQIIECNKLPVLPTHGNEINTK